MSTPEHHTTRSSPNTADTVILQWPPSPYKTPKRSPRIPNQTNRYVNTPETVRLDKYGREIPISESKKMGRKLDMRHAEQMSYRTPKKADKAYTSSRTKKYKQNWIEHYYTNPKYRTPSKKGGKSRKNRTKKSFWKKWFGM